MAGGQSESEVQLLTGEPGMDAFNEMTDAELKLMANAAIIGESSQPVSGYSTAAARGMRSEL